MAMKSQFRSFPCHLRCLCSLQTHLIIGQDNLVVFELLFSGNGQHQIGILHRGIGGHQEDLARTSSHGDGLSLVLLCCQDLVDRDEGDSLDLGWCVCHLQ